MATVTEIAPIPPHTMNGSNQENDAEAALTSNISSWTPYKAPPHPQTDEIIRQVEFYFSDESLPHDAHLLGLFQEGKGTVSFNEITGFKKMRSFKPKTAVREALRQSELVVVSKDGKRLSRKYPLDKSLITVIPKINPDRKKNIVPEDKPWLTKGMMKPTGFETTSTDGPITPEEYAQERHDYDPDNSFASRIETAITRFCARRKMHQLTRTVFTRFLMFGGFDDNERQFIGGVDEKAMEDYTKKEIAEMTSYYGVSDVVMNGIDEGGVSAGTTWLVDFELVAKAFLSSQLKLVCDGQDGAQVVTACRVLHNFYNYLLLHDVCTEYTDQLLAARKVCDQAEDELLKLTEVDHGLPGGFNKACSTLFDGNFAGVYPIGDWCQEDDKIGWSNYDAELVFTFGVFAHGSKAQEAKLAEAKAKGISTKNAFKVVNEENLGLEVVGVEFARDEAKGIYNDDKVTGTIIRPMGKLKCARWEVPHASPTDLPKSATKAKKLEKYEFLVEEETLQQCVVGMKLECCVKELDIGIKWIDYVEASYVSFFTWLANERIREWKAPKAPTSWMVSKMVEEGAIAQPQFEEVDDEQVDKEVVVEEMD